MELTTEQETQNHKYYVGFTMDLPSVFIQNRFEKRTCSDCSK